MWTAQSQQVWGDLQKNRMYDQLPFSSAQNPSMKFCWLQHHTSYPFSNWLSIDECTFSPFLTKISSLTMFIAHGLAGSTGNLSYFATVGLLGGRRARTWAGKCLCFITRLWWHAVSLGRLHQVTVAWSIFIHSCGWIYPGHQLSNCC